MICEKCKIDKPQTDFYFRKDCLKYRTDCKDCFKEVSLKRYEKNRENPVFIEKEKERAIKKYYRLYSKGCLVPKNKYTGGDSHRKRYPEKYSAADRTKNIRKDGFHCHHWSYNKPHWLDILYLTVKHHMKAHRFLIYDQERMMYRRTDSNELLDTKEKHLEWINWCLKNKQD